MSYFAWLAVFVTCACLLAIGIAVNHNNEKEKQCADNMGVYIQTRNGNFCIVEDAVIILHDE